MYMNVKELNEQQLEQLKMKVFYDFDSADDFLLDKLSEELSFEEYEMLQTADCWTDIPNEIIYKLYEDISFVEEDFGFIEETTQNTGY